jgi:hypothetical protein
MYSLFLKHPRDGWRPALRLAVAQRDAERMLG